VSRPAAYATLALVLAVCGWFTADDRLLANAGLVVCGLVAVLVYRRVWVRLRTQAHAELVGVFEWCQGCNELAPRASMGWLTPELYRCDLWSRRHECVRYGANSAQTS
jgi:hypothetical protein